MKKTSTIIVMLTISLLVSNGWWLYQAYDVAVAASYQDVSHRQTEGALEQVLAILPLACCATETEIVEAAKPPYYKSQPFEKGGYIWVGNIGLAFNQNGNVIKVAKAWQ